MFDAITRLFPGRRGSGHRRLACALRLAIEVLEDRTVPSVLQLTSEGGTSSGQWTRTVNGQPESPFIIPTSPLTPSSSEGYNYFGGSAATNGITAGVGGHRAWSDTDFTAAIGSDVNFYGSDAVINTQLQASGNFTLTVAAGPGGDTSPVMVSVAMSGPAQVQVAGKAAVDGGTYLAQVGDTITITITTSENQTCDTTTVNQSNEPSYRDDAEADISITPVSFTPYAGGPYEITQGQDLGLDASATSNPDSLPLTYSWDINVNGTWQNGVASGETPTLTWAQLQGLGITAANSPYQVRVEATDTSGGTTVTSDPTTLTIDAVQVPLSVKADHNDPSNGPKDFGTYLPGVDLDTTFKTTAIDPNHLVKKVQYQIDGGPHATASGSGPWTFTTNVGDLDPGKHTLTVTALDANNNPVGTYTGYIHVGGPASITLKDGTAASSALRFITGIDAPVTLSGTLTGVEPFYANLLQYDIDGGTPTKLVASASGNKITFTARMNGNVLHTGTDNAFSVLIGGQDLSDFGATDPTLTSIDKPAWLSGGAVTFSGGSYQFKNVNAGLLRMDLGTVSTGISWLDSVLPDLTTYGSAMAVLDILAPLDTNQEVDFKASKLVTEVEVLGQPIHSLSKTYQSGSLNFGGTLDSHTLDPNGLSVSLKNPENLKSGTLFDHSISIPVFPNLSGVGNVTLNADLKIKGTASLNAGISLTTVGGVPTLMPGGSFVELDAKATGTVTADVKASALTAEILFGGSVTANLNVVAKTSFAGPLLTPTVTNPSVTATLDGSYQYHMYAALLNGELELYKYTSPVGTFGPKTILELS